MSDADRNENLIVFCRPGFENEAGLELTDRVAELGGYGYFRPEPGQGWLRYYPGEPMGGRDILDRLELAELVFVRDWWLGLAEVTLPPEDRVGAVIECLRSLGRAPIHCQRVDVRLPENNSDRDLGNFSRKWVAPLSRGLRGAGLLADKTGSGVEGEGGQGDRLEVLLTGFDRCLLGLGRADNRAPFPMGIPRLRLAAEAPSRSALKLEEAWKVLLPPGRQLDYLGGGKKAVDLGAAPGGWTWQLVRQGMRVIAVDNGPMNEVLMASGMVEHVEADGYVWRPRRAVDWMVCDIVDKPRRTAAMVADWMTGRLCRFTLFNLKLPMKTRYQEWLQCRALLENQLTEAGLRYRLRARQLYHDREEITCFIERLDH